LHGHCHEKAIVGTDATAALLTRLGCDVDVLDAGCCGMAGSFGFEQEHYDLSMRIAESRLLPAVRREPDTTIVVATGVSCRQQIAHGAAGRAFHPVELLRAAVGDASEAGFRPCPPPRRGASPARRRRRPAPRCGPRG